MDPVYTAINGLGLALPKAMNWDVRVRGAERIPSRGPAVIAANHVSFLDFVFIEFAARTRKRLVRFMAVQEAFHHWLAGPFSGE